MKRIFAISIIVTAACFTVRAQLAEGEKIVVFEPGEDGSRYYRIPAIAVASDGSLVAVADRRGDSPADLPNIISVVAKRSTDGGRTWSRQTVIAKGDSAAGKTYGDPALIRDRRTGNLVCVFTGDNGFFASTPENPQRIYVSRSFDDGLSWEAPREISSQFYQPGWQGGFAASGSMMQTADGRIMFVMDTRTLPEWKLEGVYEYVISSPDGGVTWEVLNPQAKVPSDGRGNESKLLELSDGRLLMSIRTPGCRRFAFSADGGKTWSSEAPMPDLVEPDCNGDIIAVEDSCGQRYLLHSLPADAHERRNVSVYISTDEGKTWPYKKTITEIGSGYSALVALPDGSVGCLFEEDNRDGDLHGSDGYRIMYTRFYPGRLQNFR